MESPEPFTPSAEFADHFFLAIDHAFASIEDGGGPLVPFTMTADISGQKKLDRFVAEPLEAAVEAAKASILPDPKLTMYAIAWDGHLTSGEQRVDALFVEAGETSAQTGCLFAQRYVQKKVGLLRRVRCERVGNPALLDERPPSGLWRQPRSES